MNVSHQGMNQRCHHELHPDINTHSSNIIMPHLRKAWLELHSSNGFYHFDRSKPADLCWFPVHSRLKNDDWRLDSALRERCGCYPNTYRSLPVPVCYCTVYLRWKWVVSALHEWWGACRVGKQRETRLCSFLKMEEERGVTAQRKKTTIQEK